MIKLTISGRPITKKNSQQIIQNKGLGKPMVIQSRRYRQYEEDALWQLKQYRAKLTGKVEMCARYYMPDKRSWPDLVGLLQSTMDILEKAGVIENDRDIVSVDGSEIAGVDKENPRVEVELKEVKDG